LQNNLIILTKRFLLNFAPIFNWEKEELGFFQK